MNLRDMLSQMVIECNANLLAIQERNLLRGLTIRVYVEPDMLIHLALIRDDVFPSQSEWDTVMRCWPQPLPIPWPKPKAEIGRKLHHRALTACWRVPRPEMQGAMELNNGALS